MPLEEIVWVILLGAIFAILAVFAKRKHIPQWGILSILGLDKLSLYDYIIGLLISIALIAIFLIIGELICDGLLAQPNYLIWIGLFCIVTGLSVFTAIIFAMTRYKRLNRGKVSELTNYYDNP